MSFTLTCTTAASVDGATRDRICNDFLNQLRIIYPEQSLSQNGKGLGLEFLIATATPFALSIQLIWAKVSGEVAQGKVLTVSAMERGLTTARQISLYQRALAKPPLPV